MIDRIIALFLIVFSSLTYSQVSEEIIVDLHKIPSGTFKRFEWKGFPVFVLKLTKTQISSVEKNQHQISEKLQQLAFDNLSKSFDAELTNLLIDSTRNKRRLLKQGIVVLFGVSQESGCMFVVNYNKDHIEDPCTLSKYSLDGRPLKVNDKYDFSMLIPPYSATENTVTILRNSEFVE
jgi:Rieske Fe-S protein